jgi:predicted transcriptional regulator of viral defense system
MKKLHNAQNGDILLKFLDENEIEIFTAKGLSLEKELRITHLQPTLEQLVKRGLLSRIEKGKYCKHTFRNVYVISNILVEDGVIAYWSALNLHGLTEQIPNTIFVQTAKPKVDKKVFGINYKFIHVKSKKMIGIVRQGRGNNQFRITDKEKTIVDCFDLQKYSGGFLELIRAFAMIDLDVERLIEYSEASNNLSAIKRIAFLGTFLKKVNFEKYSIYAKSKLNEKYSLFDALGSNKGSFVREWRLRMNLDETAILNILTKT